MPMAMGVTINDGETSSRPRRPRKWPMRSKEVQRAEQDEDATSRKRHASTRPHSSVTRAVRRRSPRRCGCVQEPRGSRKRRARRPLRVDLQRVRSSAPEVTLGVCSGIITVGKN